MADRFPASITIGGKLSRHAIARLIGAIREDGPMKGDWETPFVPNNAQDLLDACIAGRLFLTNPEARYGEMPDIEATCVALGLTFVRKSKARYEFDAETVWYDSNFPELGVRSSLSRQDGALVVPRSEFDKVISRIIALADFLKENRHKHLDFDTFQLRLYHVAEDAVVANPSLPEIPKFEISNCDHFGSAPYISFEYDLNFFGGK